VEREAPEEGRGGFRLTPEYEAVNRRRMESLVPDYLARLIPAGARVCSIGCGTAYDVELLVNLGYDAYGFDGGERTAAWSNRSPSVRSRLRTGLAEDKPFGDSAFDFGYALEVIEHVGCGDGGWEILDTTHDARVRFVESCVDMLRDGGRLFLSTSNRLCPVDIGHMHRYSRLTEKAGRLGIPLTLPWHPLNFVLSCGDIERLVRRSRVADRVRVRPVSPRGYLAFSSHARARRLRNAVNAYMSVVSLPLLRTSPANPLTTVILEGRARAGRLAAP
jgi:SAM-dependent methyltransferase